MINKLILFTVTKILAAVTKYLLKLWSLHCVCIAKFKIVTAFLAAILIFLLFYYFIWFQKIVARSFRLLTQTA